MAFTVVWVGSGYFSGAISSATVPIAFPVHVTGINVAVVINITSATSLPTYYNITCNIGTQSTTMVQSSQNGSTPYVFCQVMQGALNGTGAINIVVNFGSTLNTGDLVNIQVIKIIGGYADAGLLTEGTISMPGGTYFQSLVPSTYSKPATPGLIGKLALDCVTSSGTSFAFNTPVIYKNGVGNTSSYDSTMYATTGGASSFIVNGYFTDVYDFPLINSTPNGYSDVRTPASSSNINYANLNLNIYANFVPPPPPTTGVKWRKIVSDTTDQIILSSS